MDWQAGLRRLWAAVAALAVVRGTPDVAGDVDRRAQEAYDRLTAADQPVVDDLLARAPGPEHRDRIRTALAGGAAPAALARFAAWISEVGDQDLGVLLDPTSPRVTAQRAERGPVLQQATGTTCGSASLVVARMLSDPVYALAVLGGYDAATGRTLPGGVTPAGVALRFGAQETVVQSRTSSSRSSRARPIPGWKLPWPTALGTPPWGASEEMSLVSGVRRTTYRVRMIDPDSPDDLRRTCAEVARAVDHGLPVPVYTGSGALPRHVVLAVGRTPEGDLEVFNPATGTVRRLSEAALVAGGDALARVVSWPRVWAAVLPVTGAPGRGGARSGRRRGGWSDRGVGPPGGVSPSV